MTKTHNTKTDGKCSFAGAIRSYLSLMPKTSVEIAKGINIPHNAATLHSKVLQLTKQVYSETSLSREGVAHG